MTTFSSFSRVLRTGSLPANGGPFHVALADLRHEALALTQSGDWLDRWCDSFGRYFDGCLLEYRHRSDFSYASIDEYRRLRAWSIGTYPVFDLIEPAHGHILPNAIAWRPDLVALRERAALLCAWVNDIYSHAKEQADGDALNLVAVLQREYGLNTQEAFGAAAEVFNTDLTMFEDQKRVVVGLHSEAVQSYVKGLEDWVHGNFSWTGLSQRYGADTSRVAS